MMCTQLLMTSSRSSHGQGKKRSTQQSARGVESAACSSAGITLHRAQLEDADEGDDDDGDGDDDEDNEPGTSEEEGMLSGLRRLASRSKRGRR